MVQLASLLAAVLFLLPVVTFVALRLRADSELWEIALDVPIALAIDFYSVLTLAVVLRLGIAFWVSRALWLVGSIAWFARRKHGVRRWPRQLTGRPLFAAALAAATTTWLSLQVSRRYSIFDRSWHIPLVASLRGQSLPFHNVIVPGQRLFYHFSGDVYAAMLQSASLAVIHAALALSLAHDLFFALIGFVLGLVLSWVGYRRWAAFVLGPLAVLTAGPMTIFRGGVRAAQHGYSIINVLSLSFRPHMALGDLLMIAFVVTLVVTVTREAPPAPVKTVSPLIACTALLALTDETSLGVIALALGLVWLIRPDIVHPKRTRGVLVFVGLAGALIVPNLIFGGALYPGAQHHSFSIVPWRSPGCYTRLLPLSTHKGRVMLLYDVFPTLAVLGGVGLHWLTRRRSRDRAILLVFLLLVSAISIVALTHIDFDHQPKENHRFMLAAEIVAPLVGVLFIAPGRDWVQRRSNASPYAVALIIAGMLAGSLSTADWLYWICPRWAQTYKSFWARIDHYKIDCRTETGARIAMKTKPHYMARPVSYLYSGCVPLYTAGKVFGSSWKLTIGKPWLGLRGAELTARWNAPGTPLPVVCPQGRRQDDPVCRRALASGACRSIGHYVQVCQLPPAALR